MRILVADDDVVALEMLRHALAREGHEVLTASNGRQALELVQKGEARLIISDWEMPELDGLELCRHVRAQGADQYVYIIMLTGRGGLDNLVEGLSAGADDFMSKPFSPAELAVRVRTAERILSLETRDITIFALAKLAESRDPETGKHLERVRNFARLLAAELANSPKFAPTIDGQFIRLIYQTSPLHDIGKVAIPDSILLKPDRLSEREYDIMRTDTLRGAETLDAAVQAYPNARYLQMARDIAIAHHERWDGTGYPNNLAGEAIPLPARIVALADVYDALTSKRVYKDAFSHEVARAIILEGRGTHFDPDIVDAFTRCEPAMIDIALRCRETHESEARSPAA